VKPVIEFKADDMKKLHDRLLQLGAATGQKVLASAARQALKPVRDDARRMAPVDSGALRESIRIQVKKPRSGDAVVVAGLAVTTKRVTIDEDLEADVLAARASGAGYRWHFAEFGVPSRGIAPKPFLRPAFAKNREVMVRVLKEQLRKLIKKAAVGQLARESATKGGG
jgi:HK97 gp10 family phage protein